MKIDSDNIELLEKIWTSISYAVFGFIGGVIGYMLRNTIESPFRLVNALINGLSAGFVGQLVYMLCEALAIEQKWIGILVGVSGLIGAKSSIELAEVFLYKKFKIRTRRVTDKKL